MKTLELLITHHFGGGVYAKETCIPADRTLIQHKHKHAHLSILAHGKAAISAGGKPPYVVEGPAVIIIEAETYHSVHARTDCVWYCIHATDELDYTKVDETLISHEDHTS